MKLQDYISKLKANKKSISQKRIEKLQNYEEMASDFGEEIEENEFDRLMKIEMNDFEKEETKYRSKKANLVLADLPDDEQAAKVRRYTKRLYKWFAVYITKEQVNEMYKMSDTDMHKRYIKLLKEN